MLSVTCYCTKILPRWRQSTFWLCFYDIPLVVAVACPGIRKRGPENLNLKAFDFFFGFPIFQGGGASSENSR